ncbi:hypothetical protein CoNPh11_CDS0159 [Staphylococcus phage S-CoN_Ph11]|nr:hypothetical protein CoNPh11_CDS0159 [Staphylococcus phage S-CoN_Ph11]
MTTSEFEEQLKNAKLTPTSEETYVKRKENLNKETLWKS